MSPFGRGTPVIGWCLCAVKNTNEDDPFWVGYVPVTKREGTKFWFRRPGFVGRPQPSGRGAYHYKLLPQFLIEGAEEPPPIAPQWPFPRPKGN